MMLRGIFLTTIVLFVFGNAVGNQHLLFAPQVIREGAYENVVVSLHGIQGQVKVIASVNLGGIANFQKDNQDATKPILIAVRYVRNNAPKKIGVRQYVELIVTVTQNNKNIYQSKLKMLVVEDSGYLYVQTDRPVYRPQEIVKFRIAALTQTYKPERERKVQVVIRIPLENVGISEKTFTMTDDDKFIEDLFHLPEYPVFGLWSVQARFEEQDTVRWSTREFEVRPYVLPTFNVRIVLERPFIVVKKNLQDEYIKGKLTAEYSYGRKIYGNYYLAARLVRKSNSRPKTFFEFPSSNKQARISNGVANFDIKTTEILNAVTGDPDFENLEAHEKLAKLKDEGATVFLEASVTGQDDGNTETDKTSVIPLVDSPYIIKIDRMSKYYTRGTSFEIKADILDSVSERPVQQVPVILSGPLFCGNQRCGDKKCCVAGKCVDCPDIEINSDENGQINFNINMDATATPRIYQLRTGDFGVAKENQASLEFTLQPYTSSGVLQLSAKKKIATVGSQAFQVVLRYKSSAAGYQFRYIIAARGRFVASGVGALQPNTIQHTMQVPITGDMVPSFRLFVYYYEGNQMVSNSLWVDVKDACKKEITVSVPKEVLPGQQIQVNYEGSPNALIGVSAVDRAAYFLYGDSRLTRYSVFDGLNQYDRGCYREGGKDAQHVFEVAGFQVVSSSYKAKEDFTTHCQGATRKKRAANVVNAVFSEVQSIDLADCGRDAIIEVETDEPCEKRAENVLDNHGRECAEVFNEKCKEHVATALHGRSARSAGGNAKRQKALATTRSNFEESMLWSTEMLRPDGTLTLDMLAKHSITTFEFDTISIHPDDGFCVAETQNMTIFKDIFIKLHIPYSLKRREQAQIRATIFNYASQSKKLRLEVKVGKDICSHFPEEKFTEIATVTIRPNAAAGFNFVVLPLRIPKTGKVEIEAKAYAEDNSILDHIKRSVLVEPEGEIREIKGTKTFDLRDKREAEFSFYLRFPENFVPETRKCWLYPFSNFMGPIIQFDPVTKQPTNDIHSIIRMPGGCGEQTMLSMGPNVYAHKYLDSVGKMKPNSPEYRGSIEKMKSGFANELKYRCNCNPKVWSVFPRGAPSAWLNAYVNKVFAQAKVFYTTMDKTPICASIGWLTTLQNADGSFKTGGRVYHQEMHGAVGSQLTLSAYILMSLVESVSLCDDLVKTVEQAILKATGYLETQENIPQMSQPYAIALVTYAMTVADVNNPFSIRLRQKLLKQFQYSDDNRLAFLQSASLAQIRGTGTHAYWYERKSSAIDIEATGYGLMAIVYAAGVNTPVMQSTLDLTRKVVLWLIEQRDEKGGFSTTQDTVVGLQALADYMIWSNLVTPNKDREVKIDLTIKSAEGTEFFNPPLRYHLDKSNENVTTPIEVPPKAVAKGILNVTANGRGEGTLSYRCVYRTLIDEDACHFDLAVTAQEHKDRVSNPRSENKPVILKLVIAVSKPEGDPVGQSLVEITLLSGYKANEDSLKRLSRENFVDGIIERYEIVNQKVVLYLREVTDKRIILALLINREVNVKDPQPATVTVYHYYEPSIRCSKFYALPNNMPQLRTTPCKDALGQGSEDMCKCAEGGCLKCRTRKEQLEKTLCVPGMKTPCKLCNEENKKNCFNMTAMACSSSYVYVVNITEHVKDTTGVFVGFKARIETLYKRGADSTAKSNSERTFVTRTDCHHACKDDILKSPDKDKSENHKLFSAPVPNNRVLMFGKVTEEKTDRNGNQIIQYNLMEGDYVERIYPEKKCRAARIVVNGMCKRKKRKNRKQKEKCQKNRAIDQSCNNLRLLRRMLIRGCD